MSQGYSLFKVGEIWHYRFKIPGPPRVQKSTHERIRARAVIVAEDAYRAALLHSRGEKPCPTVRGLVLAWLADPPNNPSPAYLRSMETFGRLHLYGLGDMLLTEVRNADVVKARAEHLKTHAPASCNQWLDYLKLLFNWALSERMIKVIEWRVKRLRFQRKPKMLLSPSDTEAWLAAVDEVATPTMATIIRITLGTGLREQEAAAARWEGFDWDNGRHKPKPVYRPWKTKGKEAKPRPIPGWLVDYLKPKAKRSGWVAPAPKGEPFSPGHMRRVMAKANAKLGIKGLTPHRLRGSYITHLLAQGVPPTDVQAVVGHADVKTTFGYAELDLDRVRRGQDEIAREANLAGRKSGEPRRHKQATAGVAR